MAAAAAGDERLKEKEAAAKLARTRPQTLAASEARIRTVFCCAQERQRRAAEAAAALAAKKAAGMDSSDGETPPASSDSSASSEEEEEGDERPSEQEQEKAPAQSSQVSRIPHARLHDEKGREVPPLK